jgi:hypothetical protein
MFGAIGFNQQDIVKDGLVLWLDVNDKTSYPGTGTSWRDLSRGGNNGTLTNGPTFNSGNGGSIVFDGGDDYSDHGDASSINIPDSLSVNMWIKINLIDGNWRGVISKRRTDGVTNYGINFNGGANLLQWYFNNGSGYTILSVSLSANFTTGVWYNLCTIFQKSSTNTLAFLYSNGILLNSGTLSGNVGTAVVPLSIGRSFSGGEYFSGNVATTQIYNRALSQNEITQNYNATKARFGL